MVMKKGVKINNINFHIPLVYILLISYSIIFPIIDGAEFSAFVLDPTPHLTGWNQIPSKQSVL